MGTFISIRMLKNSKTSYIVPGYTGHLPKSAQPQPDIPVEDPHGQIPGYCGYIELVKPENIFGQTYVNQSQVRQRTAANIVGVNPLPPNYRAPTGEFVAQCEPMQQQLDECRDTLNNGTNYIGLDQTIPG